MINFSDNRKITFEILEEDSRYSKELLSVVKSGRYELIPLYLNEIERNNKDIMEPLLYAAIKETKEGFNVFKQYGNVAKEKIEMDNDLILAVEIINYNPELIKDTPLNDYRNAILEGAKLRPEVIQYMSDELKSDITFIEDLCEINNDEISKYAVKECTVLDQIDKNSSLLSNEHFMKEAIKEDVSLLRNADESLKNNYSFIKEVARENKEVINYITEHTDEFEKEGLNAAKEVLVEDTTNKAVFEFEEELKNAEAEKTAMESKEGFDKNSKEYKKILLRVRHAKSGIRVMNRIKNSENPRRALGLIDKLSENLGEEYRAELIKYFKLDDAVIEKQKLEKDKFIVEPENIENISKDNRIGDINKDISGIREEYIEDIRLKEGENSIENVDIKSIEE